jgi:hypothetical protein
MRRCLTTIVLLIAPLAPQYALSWNNRGHMMVLPDALPVKDIATLVDVSGIDQNNKVTNLEHATVRAKLRGLQETKRRFLRASGFINTGVTLTGLCDPQNIPAQIVSAIDAD